MNGVVKVRIKHSLSKQHMRGSRLLAAKALEIESRGRPIPETLLRDGAFHDRSRAA
jgi:hypothetical protein